MPTDKKNPKPYNFLGPETDRENALYRAEIEQVTTTAVSTKSPEAFRENEPKISRGCYAFSRSVSGPKKLYGLGFFLGRNRNEP